MPPKGTCYFCGKKDVYITIRWKFDGKGDIIVCPCCLNCDKALEEIAEMNDRETDERKRGRGNE